jgi:hypothetical protein
MSRSNNSSILVLATLGVYLGLLMTGATPQLLANAAMTREFNVVDEIEGTDDLDKKPKGAADPFTESIHVYLQDLDRYLSDVTKADEYLRSVYDPVEARIAGNYVGVYRRDPELLLLAPCHRIGNSKGLFDLEKATHFTRLPILLNPEYDKHNWSWDHMGCKRLDGSREEKAAFAEIEVSGTQKGLFTYQVSIKLSSNEQVSHLFENLDRAFRRVAAADFSNRQRVLWENTQLTKTEDKVLIVTRLPRGSLDSLLAPSAK